MSLGICRQQRPRSACAYAQSDQDLHYSLTESMDTIECINREQMPGWDFKHTRDESESVHLIVFTDTFLLDAAHITGMSAVMHQCTFAWIWHARLNKKNGKHACFHIAMWEITVFFSSFGKTFFAWCFILSRKIYLWLTMSYQKKICLFCSCTLFWNIYHRINFTAKSGHDPCSFYSKVEF